MVVVVSGPISLKPGSSCCCPVHKLQKVDRIKYIQEDLVRKANHTTINQTAGAENHQSKGKISIGFESFKTEQ